MNEVVVRGSLDDFQQELITAIRKGEWRTVVIGRDRSGTVQEMFFPIDDLRLRAQYDMAACEFVPLLPEKNPSLDKTKTLFGSLRVRDGRLCVCEASDYLTRPVSDTMVTQLLRDYLDG